MTDLENFRILHNVLIHKSRTVQKLYRDILTFSVTMEEDFALNKMTSSDGNYCQNGHDFDDVKESLREEFSTQFKDGFIHLTSDGLFKEHASALDLYSFVYLDIKTVDSKFDTLPEIADLDIDISLPEKETTMLVKAYSGLCASMINTLRRIETETSYLKYQFDRFGKDYAQAINTGTVKINKDLDVVQVMIDNLKAESVIDALGYAPTHFSSSDKDIRISGENRNFLLKWAISEQSLLSSGGLNEFYL